MWDEGNLINCSESNKFLHSIKINETKPINFSESENAASGGAVCSGTELKGGKSRFRFPMESLEIFIDKILLAALCPWS